MAKSKTAAYTTSEWIIPPIVAAAVLFSLMMIIS